MTRYVFAVVNEEEKVFKLENLIFQYNGSNFILNWVKLFFYKIEKTDILNMILYRILYAILKYNILKYIKLIN